MKQLLRTLLCLLSIALFGLSTFAADAAATDAKTPTLSISELRDTGGLPDQDDGTQLNVKLTQAFRSILKDEAKGTVAIVEKVDPKKSTVSWSLDGDLSGVDNGQGTTNYLCVMRLYREGKKRELLAQWSGVADTLRFLTGNLAHISGVHENGLVGEIGQRALAVIKNEGKVDMLQALTKVAANLPEAKETTLTLSTVEGNTLPVADNLVQLTAGTPFAITVAAATAGPYLFAVQSASDIRLACLQKVVKDTGMGGRVQFTAPMVKVATTGHLYFFIRARTMANILGNEMAPEPGTQPATAADTALPVRIQEVVTRQAQTNATIADVLLTLLQSDPQGSWVLKTVDYRVNPAK